MDRGTCWSITINNPTESDFPNQNSLAPGWTYEGQIEVGEQGTRHYQGMVKTPQVRFSAVKKVFPRAHIEKAKSPVALQKYVHKDDTRLEVVPTVRSAVPTLWDYQDIIANMWFDEDWQEYLKQQRGANEGISVDDVALSYVDKLVSMDIRNGRRGAEFIAINPMWRSSWKKFWKDIIFRANGISDGQVIADKGFEEATESSPQALAEETRSSNVIIQ